MAHLAKQPIDASNIVVNGFGGFNQNTLGQMQTTGVNGGHQHTSINTSSSSMDLMDVINGQAERIEELEKMVNLLIAEVLPERAI